MKSTLGLVVRVVIVTTLVIGSWWHGLDVHAEAQVEAGLKRALIAFAVARGLNGVISVAQGTEVAIQPAGLGVVLAPGEIPVDRIEGKFKLNQNRSREDQEGVVAALEASTDPSEREIARLMRENLDRGAS